MQIKDHIRQIADFPKPGILFYDISTLLAHAKAWQHTMHLLAEKVRPQKPDLLVGIESRGFLVAAPLALMLDCGFVMVRKKGKLPGATIPFTYDLEYGTDTVEVQADAIRAWPARGGARRSPGHRRHDAGGDRAAAQGRSGRAGGRLHHRARLPQRPHKAGRAGVVHRQL